MHCLFPTRAHKRPSGPRSMESCGHSAPTGSSCIRTLNLVLSMFSPFCFLFSVSAPAPTPTPVVVHFRAHARRSLQLQLQLVQLAVLAVADLHQLVVGTGLD